MATKTVKIKGGDKLRAKLIEIAKRAGKAGTLRVGFLEGAKYPDGTPVAQVAAIQNFGAPAVGIPARAFFSDMVAEKSPRWGQTLGKIAVAADYDSDVTLGRMGVLIAGQLQKSITDTNEPPLAESTIASKGFDKPLIDTAHMINSIDYQVDDKRANRQGLRSVPSPGAKK